MPKPIAVTCVILSQHADLIIVQYNNSKTFSWRKVIVASGAWYWSADTTFVDKRRLHMITHQKLIMCEVVQLMVS